MVQCPLDSAYCGQYGWIKQGILSKFVAHHARHLVTAYRDTGVMTKLYLGQLWENTSFVEKVALLIRKAKL